MKPRTRLFSCGSSWDNPFILFCFHKRLAFNWSPCLPIQSSGVTGVHRHTSLTAAHFYSINTSMYHRNNPLKEISSWNKYLSISVCSSYTYGNWSFKRLNNLFKFTQREGWDRAEKSILSVDFTAQSKIENHILSVSHYDAQDLANNSKGGIRGPISPWSIKFYIYLFIYHCCHLLQRYIWLSIDLQLISIYAVANWISFCRLWRY